MLSTNRQIWTLSNQQAAVPLEELITRYDQQAADWQATIEKLRQPEAYTAVFEQLVSHQFVQQGEERLAVLDCGIGTGALSEALAQHMPEQTVYHGVDISTKMLMQARNRLHLAGLSFLLRRGSVTNLNYPNGSFDMVMSAHVLEHLPNPEEGLDEMLRVLKPGGVLLLMMTRRTMFGSWIRHKWGVHQLRPQQLVGWLDSAGLQKVRPITVGKWWGVNRWLSVACVGQKCG